MKHGLFITWYQLRDGNGTLAGSGGDLKGE